MTRPIPCCRWTFGLNPVVSVPAVPKPRYYSVQLTDANTFNYGYIGSRATGTGPGDYMIVGPDWKGEKPAHIRQVFHSSTQFTLVLFRTQLFNPADMPNVIKIQAGYKAQPLSASSSISPPRRAPAINFPKADAELAKKNFFEYSILRFSIPRQARKKRRSAPSWPVSASVPGKKFE